MRTGVFAVLLALVCCCNSEDATPTPVVVPQVEAGVDADPPDGSDPPDAGPDATDARPDGPPPVPGNLRVMAANISSGPSLVYGPIEGVRIFQGLHPDVVLMQEMNVGDNQPATIDAYVSSTFGATFSYYRETGSAALQIPNGIVSRYPILESGSWADPSATNRGFAYAKLAVPGPHPLWAISLHLLTSGGTQRSTEVASLVTQVKTIIPAADYLVLGGDFNTSLRNEDCVINPTTGLAAIVMTAAPYPADGSGNENTSAPRSKPYDWVLADADLGAFAVPVVIGQRGFAAGLVFDSRVFTPLSDVAPVQATDSAAVNMQHMPVVRDFRIPE